MRSVTFDALGAAHALRFTTNAVCVLEQRTGQSLEQVLGDTAVAGKRVSTYRLLMWAGLGCNVTLDYVGEIMDELGPVETDRLIAAAVKASFPPQDQSEAGNGEAAA